MKGESSTQAGPGEKLCDGVYLLQQPREQAPTIEIIFIHGLTLIDGNRDAYWKTWLVQDSDECWPITWLKARHPNARVLSLSYDACAEETATTGRMDLHAVGESLMRQMGLPKVEIGQNNCPVVFVCHSFGGLVAKQIAVTASGEPRSDERSVGLLQNIKGFFFYGTPHAGLACASYCYSSVHRREGPLVSDLKMLNDKVGRLNNEFIFASMRHEWKFSVVAESHETTYSKWRLVEGSTKMVEETSARLPGHPFLQIGADHNNLCKPGSDRDSSFLALSEFLSKIMKLQERPLPSLPKGLVDMSHNRGSELLETLDRLVVKNLARPTRIVDREATKVSPFKGRKWSKLAYAGSSTAPNLANHAGDEARCHRGSVAGDYELDASTKIQVFMKSHETLRFYILTTDSSNPSPKFLFPEGSKMDNLLGPRSSGDVQSEDVQRQFPNKSSFNDDPPFWFITKSKTGPRKHIEECRAYFVFTKEPLRTDDVRLTIEHLKEKLCADSVIVEVLKFLVL